MLIIAGQVVSKAHLDLDRVDSITGYLEYGDVRLASQIADLPHVSLLLIRGRQKDYHDTSLIAKLPISRKCHHKWVVSNQLL